MRNEITILAVVSILAIAGLALSSSPTTTAAATNPGLACDGYWTYLYALQDGGGLQCVETTKAPTGGSYSGGGGLGSWGEPQNIRKLGPTRGFTARELEQLKNRNRPAKLGSYD